MMIATRRDFLFRAGDAAMLPAVSTVSAKKTSANDKIHLGVIGIGPRCRRVLKGMLPWEDLRCVAIADVQASRRQTGKEQVDGHYGNRDCLLYRDFRELLHRKDIDAVLIATGDRWHADASILAAEAGKDVCSEKPCGITIEACQRLARARCAAKNACSKRERNVAAFPISKRRLRLPGAASWEESTLCMPRFIGRFWKTLGFRPSLGRIGKSAIGICGLDRRLGVPSIPKRTSFDNWRN